MIMLYSFSKYFTTHNLTYLVLITLLQLELVMSFAQVRKFSDI